MYKKPENETDFILSVKNAVFDSIVICKQNSIILHLTFPFEKLIFAMAKKKSISDNAFAQHPSPCAVWNLMHVLEIVFLTVQTSKP